MRNGKAKFLILLTVLCCALFFYIYNTMYNTDSQEDLNLTPHSHTGVRTGTGKRTKIRKLPGCLLVGVRKGGTRALIDMMSLHTKIKVFLRLDSNIESKSLNNAFI